MTAGPDSSSPIVTIQRRRPAWCTALRPHQEDLINKAVDLFEAGVKVVFVEAPTGVGKSLAAVEIGQRLGVQTVYTCTTKQLQDQILRDFDWARVLKGRRNYIPDNVDQESGLTCEDCTGKDCDLCLDRDFCPYRVAKKIAVTSDVPVLNTAYLLKEIVGASSAFSGSELIVCDEADLLEGSLMGHVEVRVSPRLQRLLRLSPPTRKTVADTWPGWIETALGAIERWREKNAKKHDLETRRTRRTLATLKHNLELCLADLTEDLNSWVYDYSTPAVIFRPVRISHLAQDYLWRHGKRFLLMSASIISAQVMADDLGLRQDEWASLTAPWVFPATNRPVYVKPIAEMVKTVPCQTCGGRGLLLDFDGQDAACLDCSGAGKAAGKEQEWPKMAQGVVELCAARSTSRILIHAVSYDLASYITSNLPAERAITYTNAGERLDALDRYRSRPGAILVAPSMERGVDLKDEDCRVQILVKVPYLSLGDKQVSARLYGRNGALWYAVSTIRTIIQATGRGIRHETDHAETWILDSQFLKLARKWGHLFPTGWKEAVSTRTAGWQGIPNAGPPVKRAVACRFCSWEGLVDGGDVMTPATCPECAANHWLKTVTDHKETTA